MTIALGADVVRHYREKGWVRLPGIFGDAETKELADELDELIERWAFDLQIPGDWRKAYMDADTAGVSKINAMHDLQYYGGAWSRAISNPRLAEAMADLVSDDGLAEFLHSTLHVKVPETGDPFPMHQDHPFYPHADQRYVVAIVHLDDTNEDNGELRFLEGSHLGGPLEHITEGESGAAFAHLPVDRYSLADTVPAPAKAGDVVCFDICTIHGSYLNRTAKPRRLVRLGYRHPDNVQVGGQSFGRPGLMVHGTRPRAEGQAPFPTQ